MTNKFERILLSILLGMFVLLGLSFWLNIIYGFNLFYSKHWMELARLQAEHIPINPGFYFSISVAILIFVSGLFFIYLSNFKHRHEQPIVTQRPSEQLTPNNQETPKEKNISDVPVSQSGVYLTRPPRLNLPTNMAKIVAQRQQQKSQILQQPTQNTQNNSVNPYNSILAQIFTDKGFTVKPNPKISGFTPNLFAIGPDEILWIGAVDQDIAQLQSAINKLQSLFQETLEDIPITINAFILDTTNDEQSSDSVIIFKSVEKIKEFISNLPELPSKESGLDKSNFDAYSEYIDTIIQYLKSTGS